MDIEKLEENIRDIEKEMRKKGFSEEVVAEMLERVRLQQENKFHILYRAEMEGNRISGRVNASRESGEEFYLLDYTLQLGRGFGHPLGTKTLSFGAYNDTTLREGYNLTQGRSIYKESTYGSNDFGWWVTLKWQKPLVQHFETATRSVEDTVLASPLSTFLTEQSRKKLTEELKHGERVAVAVDNMGMKKEVWVEVDGASESLRVKDKDGQILELSETGWKERWIMLYLKRK